MAAFRFYPELFEHRAAVIDALSERGLAWFGDYNSVDLMHDEFGIEVTGIRDKVDAEAIQSILAGMYPGWYAG